jgi:hypothetical protein
MMRKKGAAPPPPGFQLVSPGAEDTQKTEVRIPYPPMTTGLPTESPVPVPSGLPEESVGSAAEAAFKDARVVAVGRAQPVVKGGPLEWYVQTRDPVTTKARWFYGGSIRLAYLKMLNAETKR